MAFFKKILFQILSLILVAQVGHGQQAKIILNKNNILIGELIKYDIVVEKKATENILFVIPDSIAHFELLEKTNTDTVINKINYKKTSLLITSFDSGSFYFPSLAFKKNETVFYTDSTSINVGYMPLDKDEKLRDIKPIIEVEYFNWTWIILAFGILLLLFMLYFLFKYLQKNKSKTINPLANDAYRQAMDAIQHLQKQNDADSIDDNELYHRLTTIFKTYYGSIKKSNILAQTSEQVLLQLQNLQLNQATFVDTKKALQTSDATKFAKYDPQKNENDLAISYIKNTIEEINKLVKNI